MKITDVVNIALKQAMIAKDANRLECLRGIKAAFQTLDKSEVTPTETDYLMALKKLYKQRADGVQIYLDANRLDLAKKEADEALIINEFIPKSLSMEEVSKLIDQVVNEQNYTYVKSDMGKIVKDVVARAAGQTDGKTVSTLVNELISKHASV